MELNIHLGLLRSHVYPSLKNHWFKYTFSELPLCATHMLDPGNKDELDNFPGLKELTQTSKETRTHSWSYICGALCLAGGGEGELGRIVVQEKDPKGSDT